jgi:tetratricopeptide (TPR) repeat protein
VASTANLTTPVPPARSGPRIYSREAVLVSCIASLLLLLGVTAFLSRMYHKTVHTLADNWAAQADDSVKAGDLDAAIAQYRDALAYSPNNTVYQFRLAEALAATGKNDNEAQNYLLALWDASPGSGPVNLELARVASNKPTGFAEALRYYHSAIDGEWPESPVSKRWDVRRELCEFLLKTGRIEQARVETMALADNTPTDDAAHQIIVGNLLLRSQDWNRALGTFRPLTSAEHPSPDAIAGAGTAAFNLGMYAAARDYLAKLPPDRKSQPAVQAMQTVSHEVLAADPYISGLSAKERAARAESAVQLATARAQSCIASNPNAAPKATPNGPVARAVAQLQQNAAQFDRMQKDWNERNLASFPDRLDDAMTLSFSTEAAAATACGEPQDKDRILWLLGRTKLGQS